MKKLLFLLSLLLVVFTVSAQRTDGIRPFQLKLLPEGFAYVGTASSDNQAIDIATQAELDAVSAGSGDGWGSDVVNTNATLTGDGTSGSPLAVDPSQIATSTLNNDAGFIDTEVDGDITNEAQTLTRIGNNALLDAVNSAGGGNIAVTDDLTKGKFTATGGETSFTLPSTPTGGAKELRIYRNGVAQEIGVDITVAGTTATIAGVAAEAGEIFRWEYV